MSESSVAEAVERICSDWFEVPRDLSIGNPNQGESVDRRAWRLCVSSSEITLFLPDTVRRLRQDPQLQLRYTPRLLVIEYCLDEQTGSCVLELAPTSPAAILASLFPMLADAVNRKRSEALCYAHSLCHSILSVALEQARHPTRIVKGKAARRRETFYALDRYIVENLTRPVSVRDAATALDMSGRYLNRICNDFRSLTFSQYVNFRRLERARLRLLDDPRMKIADLAREYGYREAGYFVKCFRELYGMPPDRLRSALRRSRAEARADLHAVCGFSLLEPVGAGECASKPVDLPHLTLLLINTRASSARVYWQSPTGEMHYHGEIAAGGRWIIGVSHYNVMCVRPSEDEEFFYRTADENCQLLF